MQKEKNHLIKNKPEGGGELTFFYEKEIISFS